MKKEENFIESFLKDLNKKMQERFNIKNVNLTQGASELTYNRILKKFKEPDKNLIDKIDKAKVDVPENFKSYISNRYSDELLNMPKTEVGVDSTTSEFIDKSKEIEEFWKKVNEKIQETNTIQENSLPTSDILYVTTTDSKKLPGGRTQEPVYKMNSKKLNEYKFLKEIVKREGKQNLIFRVPKYQFFKHSIKVKFSDIKKKLKSFFDLKAQKEKIKRKFYALLKKNIDKINNKMFLESLNETQRESLQNMKYNHYDVNNNSALVKLILQNKINVKDLKEKVKRIETKINNKDLLLE